MLPSIEDQVVDFYEELFDRIFSEPFRSRIERRLRSKEVIRQVEASADAASQSLSRFFLNQQLTEKQVADILKGFARLGELITLENIANPNVTPEEVVEGVLPELPCPEAVQQAEHDAIYRVALHSIIQVLMLVGPVMAEWQKLNFSSTFELPRRVVNRLNQISEQMDALGRSGQAAADERYELTYRDYLLQRFHRVEAGTVRMTTNMDVDLRELFVMPYVQERPLPEKAEDADSVDMAALMNLAAAREIYGDRGESDDSSKDEDKRKTTGLDQVRQHPHNVIVGAPGVGKSTFFEWLQVKIASVEEEFVMDGQQAIPLLLRVRQLDPQNLPYGTALIEKATASKDRAALMPPGWIERQLKTGRILFMLDGLDETEPELRDNYVMPWLLELCRRYPNCRYLISSRPVGYPPGMLRKFKFVESDLLDFNEPQIREYTRHWCTAVRLARNEPEEEARREGAADGEKIVDGFHDNPYICNLARNPLMLSAICLVNYFEGGKLPEDRALLYKLCVEGLLHNWDLRRGIHSEYSFDEKLRACREVALLMQANDQAECEAQKVQEIFTSVLDNPERAEKLLEHIRYRTGLLLERRPNIFAFAHLTFQEYLSARAVHEGNRLGVDVEKLVNEHGDGRWEEVIALYCGLVPTPTARDMIERLIAQPDTDSISTVLAEAYLSSGTELAQDKKLRWSVLERIATAPSNRQLSRFPEHEVIQIAHQHVGKSESKLKKTNESFTWLRDHPYHLDTGQLTQKLQEWRKIAPLQLGELIYLLHRYGSDAVLAELLTNTDIYMASGPVFEQGLSYGSQAEVALVALLALGRNLKEMSSTQGFEAVLRISLNQLLQSQNISSDVILSIERISSVKEASFFQNIINKIELALLARQLAKHLAQVKQVKIDGPEFARKKAIDALNSWADLLEGVG